LLFFRLLGWSMIGLAVLMASGEAIAALGSGTHDYIAAADIWALLTGTVPDFTPMGPNVSLEMVGRVLLSWPAWALMAPLGAVLLIAARPSKRKRMFADRNRRLA
jgi:hypothetical protein